ncbi:rhodanese-like domain-containing protein, partial [bacterium]|nr:rhodanese-like domain-containing protein [bacterium]
RDNTHIFVDTRAVDDGRRIPGAMVLRPDSFDEDFREIYDFLVPEDALILYGDGNLMLTSNVAQQLEARGFTELSLLRGDLDAWAAAGGDLSTEGGAP